MHSRRGVRVCLLLGVLGVVFGVGVPGALGQIPGANGRIAFTSKTSSFWHVFSMRADGTGRVKLTNEFADDLAPSFSPDGSKIAFSSERDGNRAIYVMNADGRYITRLTKGTDDHESPSWSPDGKHIVYSVNRGSGVRQIFAMKADGSDNTRLTSTFDDRGPSVSPDGTRITFSRAHSGDVNVYSMRWDGSDVVRLTNISGRDEQSSYSPDGSKITYVHVDGISADRSVYVMDADGTNKQLVASGTSAHSPSFSPDGRLIIYADGGDQQVHTIALATGADTVLTALGGQEPSWEAVPVPAPKRNGRIAFSSAQTGDRELYTVREDGTDVRQLTNSPKLDGDPTWSSDGKRLAFVTKRDGNAEIYTMTADGTDVTNLTRDPSPDSCPAWSPTERRIAYLSGSDLFTVATDGSSRRRIALNVDSCPSWSPDGNQIAYTRDGGLRVMSADGAVTRTLTAPPGTGYDAAPTWSPDGTQIAFEHTPSWPGAREISIVNADGTAARRLVGNWADQPVWSPDGTQILYQAGDAFSREIRSISPTGRNDHVVIASSGTPDSPAWESIP